MNAHTEIKRDPQVQDWLAEAAENIAFEEHDDLTHRRECLSDATHARDSFDDASDYLAANLNYYLEKAREWLAEQVAA